MTKQEMQETLELAKGNEELNEDIGIFSGFGLPDFKKVYVTKKQVAKLIRYQAFFLNGQIDVEELNSIFRVAKRKFVIVG